MQHSLHAEGSVFHGLRIAGISLRPTMNSWRLQITISDLICGPASWHKLQLFKLVGRTYNMTLCTLMECKVVLPLKLLDFNLASVKQAIQSIDRRHAEASTDNYGREENEDLTDLQKVLRKLVRKRDSQSFAGKCNQSLTNSHCRSAGSLEMQHFPGRPSFSPKASVITGCT